MLKEKVKLSNGDEVWLGGKKEYRVIYPIKKDMDKPFGLDNIDWKGKWKNIWLGGSWRKFFQTLFVILIILASVLAYRHDTAACFKILQDPQSICNYRYYGSNLALNESLLLNIGNSSLGFGESKNWRGVR